MTPGHPRPRFRWNPEQAVAFSTMLTALDDTLPQSGCGCLQERFRPAARLSSHGGYFLTEALLDAAVELGITIDLTVERVWRQKPTTRRSGSTPLRHPQTSIDCPRHPYYPHAAHLCFRLPRQRTPDRY